MIIVTAYIGDVVFELFIRSRHVWPSKRTSDLQNIVVNTVRGAFFGVCCGNIILCDFVHTHVLLIFVVNSAEHQSHLLQRLKMDYPLTEKELQVLMRGRNAVTKSKNRRNPAAYQDSTSFEALIGYLFINDQQRCTDLLNWLDTVVDEGPDVDSI